MGFGCGHGWQYKWTLLDFFVAEEGTASSFRGVKEVIEKRELFLSFYSDRGNHYWHTLDNWVHVQPIETGLRYKRGNKYAQLDIVGCILRWWVMFWCNCWVARTTKRWIHFLVTHHDERKTQKKPDKSVNDSSASWGMLPSGSGGTQNAKNLWCEIGLKWRSWEWMC